MRESIYVYGFFNVSSYFNNKINFDNHFLNITLSSSLSGIVSSIISHPFDTLKTIQQYHLYDKINYKEVINIRYLYKGCFFRTFRNSICYIILNESNSLFYNYV